MRHPGIILLLLLFTINSAVAQEAPTELYYQLIQGQYPVTADALENYEETSFHEASMGFNFAEREVPAILYSSSYDYPVNLSIEIPKKKAHFKDPYRNTKFKIKTDEIDSIWAGERKIVTSKEKIIIGNSQTPKMYLLFEDEKVADMQLYKTFNNDLIAWGGTHFYNVQVNKVWHKAGLRKVFGNVPVLEESLKEMKKIEINNLAHWIKVSDYHHASKSNGYLYFDQKGIRTTDHKNYHLKAKVKEVIPNLWELEYYNQQDVLVKTATYRFNVSEQVKTLWENIITSDHPSSQNAFSDPQISDKELRALKQKTEQSKWHESSANQYETQLIGEVKYFRPDGSLRKVFIPVPSTATKKTLKNYPFDKDTYITYFPNHQQAHYTYQIKNGKVSFISVKDSLGNEKLNEEGAGIETLWDPLAKRKIRREFSRKHLTKSFFMGDDKKYISQTLWPKPLNLEFDTKKVELDPDLYTHLLKSPSFLAKVTFGKDLRVKDLQLVGAPEAPFWEKQLTPALIKQFKKKKISIYNSNPTAEETRVIVRINFYSDVFTIQRSYWDLLMNQSQDMMMMQLQQQQFHQMMHQQTMQNIQHSMPKF
ncbi:hypothetical protein [Persicobacter psychrovividus]|uniref:DUF3857 domain-containing protein n=1 Tax=Persicobacter psychrovividus TaxID=387638 RepID=A0ABM7VFP8_9BACT|nr:hypothetical protein PEPS_20290 [Persicobacter psychrovividus]